MQMAFVHLPIAKCKKAYSACTIKNLYNLLKARSACPALAGFFIGNKFLHAYLKVEN